MRQFDITGSFLVPVSGIPGAVNFSMSFGLSHVAGFTQTFKGFESSRTLGMFPVSEAIGYILSEFPTVRGFLVMHDLHVTFDMVRETLQVVQGFDTCTVQATRKEIAHVVMLAVFGDVGNEWRYQFAEPVMTRLAHALPGADLRCIP